MFTLSRNLQEIFLPARKIHASVNRADKFEIFKKGKF